MFLNRCGANTCRKDAREYFPLSLSKGNRIILTQLPQATIFIIIVIHPPPSPQRKKKKKERDHALSMNHLDYEPLSNIFRIFCNKTS